MAIYCRDREDQEFGVIADPQSQYLMASNIFLSHFPKTNLRSDISRFETQITPSSNPHQSYSIPTADLARVALSPACFINLRPGTNSQSGLSPSLILLPPSAQPKEPSELPAITKDAQLANAYEVYKIDSTNTSTSNTAKY